MNDFTKEELQHIYDGLWMLSKLGWEKSDLTKCKKIAEMIDGYCEHEPDGDFHVVDKCKKCGAMVVYD
jgi:hypothetical protein